METKTNSTAKKATKKVDAPVEKKSATKTTETVAKEKAAAPAAKKPTAKKKAEKMLKITLVRSTNGALEKQKRTVEALGLRKIRSTVTMPDNACTRGMIFVVRHMVSVEEV